MDPFGDHLFDVFSKTSKLSTRITKGSTAKGANLKRKRADARNDLANNARETVTLNDSKKTMVSSAPASIHKVPTLPTSSVTTGGDDSDLLENLPRIKVHRVQTLEACVHEVAIPPHGSYVPLRGFKAERAKEYKFILDPFQKEAILCLDNNESVMVSAHTSAGKTVVAEYAIAMALKEKQRVIYTTPIKALSNQKYRELFSEFGDVGLMTGDVTINPTASCLIMTTEILRSMLYRGSEITREVAWVIFDEIHYMRDEERGVIWEETIILLQDTVHYVFLSATIPNARQFAEWIAFLHKQPCHVVYTEYRPVPLHHYIFPAGGDSLHLVVDEQGRFREENFNSAMGVLRGNDQHGSAGGKDKRKSAAGQTNCFRILQLIHDKGLTPCIVFSFSRRECEAYATEIFQRLDFNNDKEKKLVDEVFKNAIDVLADEDKSLPQVQSVLPLLRRGIGIHHSGILPILKETTEILFAEGLIKALFATETFSMGLNMPARTVLFTAARKFDGKEMRWINSGEYIQMSGRAGRRGIDDRGIVILVIDDWIGPNTAKDIIKGLPKPLNSAFKLTYNMVLNLLRVEGINPEFMLERSFHQFQNYATIPELQRKLKDKSAKFASMIVQQEEELSSYYKIRMQLDSLGNQLCNFIRDPQYILPFLQPGRLLKIKNNNDDFGWCIMINFQKRTQAKTDEVSYILDVATSLTKDSAVQSYTSLIKPASIDDGEIEIIPVNLNLVRNISAIRLYVPPDLRTKDTRQGLIATLREVQLRFPDGLPLLDPLEDMGIKDPKLKELIVKIEAFEDRLYSHPMHSNPELPSLYAQYEQKCQVEKEMRDARAELRKARSLLMIEELRKRKRVLRRLGYCDQADVVQLKGRVACEIDSGGGEELILTEMLFNGVFNELTVPHVAALLSCFVFQERHQEFPRLQGDLASTLRVMQDTARRVARVTSECKIEIDEEKYVDSLKPYMMDVVSAWTSGSSFAKVTKMTTIFEGSIIRCIRRLEELLRQMSCAAKAIENDKLETKFLEAVSKIKRDIIFAASLYL
ncbi:hypothetical protein GJ496_004905 [Pomphorhynchus laevis]|nr:hypothetical protein GJ496_004905 [Pomphorhynchus laevis]